MILGHVNYLVDKVIIDNDIIKLNNDNDIIKLQCLVPMMNLLSNKIMLIILCVSRDVYYAKLTKTVHAPSLRISKG